MSVKSKVEEAGHKIADTAKAVGGKIAEGAESAAAWVREKVHPNACDGHKMASGTTGCGDRIHEHMDVIASCGTKVGVVDRVEAGSIKLTKNSPNAGGVHHYVPLDWVERVDSHVHLNKNSKQTEDEWQAAPVQSGCG